MELKQRIKNWLKQYNEVSPNDHTLDVITNEIIRDVVNEFKIAAEVYDKTQRGNIRRTDIDDFDRIIEMFLLK